MHGRLTISGPFLSLVALITHGLGPWANPARGQQIEYELDYATYFGGAHGEEAREVVCTADGSVVIGGQTVSFDFPVTAGVVQETYAGEDPSCGHPGICGGDMFLVRLSGNARQTEAATFFGGSKQERNTYGLELDDEGNVVFCTGTRSLDLPTTPGAYQTAYGGGTADMMVAKVSADLTQLLWCTYVGASGEDWVRGGLALDIDDNVYLFGRTDSAGFPAPPGSLQLPGAGADAVIVKLTSDASTLEFAARIGGTQDETIMGGRIGDDGRIHFADHTWSADLPTTPEAPQGAFGGGAVDVHWGVINAAGSQLLRLTYLGGGGDEFAEHRILLRPDGSTILTGFTSSADFPTTPGAAQPNMLGSSDGFITRLSPDGTQWNFSTFLGGTGEGEFYLMPTSDAQGNLYFVGATGSADFPVTQGALQSTYAGGSSDGVLAVLSGDGTELLYATFVGGSGEDLVRGLTFGPDGEVLLVGKTNSPDFPVTFDAEHPILAGDFDAFIVRLENVPNPVPTVSDWGVIVMALLILVAGTLVLRHCQSSPKRRPPA